MQKNINKYILLFERLLSLLIVFLLLAGTVVWSGKISDVKSAHLRQPTPPQRLLPCPMPKNSNKWDFRRFISKRLTLPPGR